jgi:4'-phosphopantetheinyl transferase
MPLLTAEEQERALRFVFARDRLTFSLGRVLIRHLLTKHRPAPPEGWRFVLNPYGRPELPDPGTPPLRFNLSHCHGMVAAACVLDRDIGVDVERIDRKSATTDIARHFFSPAEVNALESLPPDRQRAAFFSFWTLKESYIKARGMGLSIPLADFSFTLDPPAISFSPRIDDRPARWQFWTADPAPCCRLAVAVSREPSEELEFALHELSWDEVAGSTLL